MIWYFLGWFLVWWMIGIASTIFFEYVEFHYEGEGVYHLTIQNLIQLFVVSLFGPLILVCGISYWIIIVINLFFEKYKNKTVYIWEKKRK